MSEISGEAYDTEKTMMLPGPPIFSPTCLLKRPPFEAEADLEQETVNIDSVTPMNEPIFEDDLIPPSTEQPEAPQMDFNEPAFSNS